MAKCELKLPDNFAERLSKLGNKTDEIVPKVLEAGGEVVLDTVKSTLHSALSGKSTGELENALGISPARVNRSGGHDVKIGFSEPRSDGTSNAKIANIFEYGRHNQTPRPFLKSAKRKSKKGAISAMQEKFIEEVGNI